MTLTDDHDTTDETLPRDLDDFLTTLKRLLADARAAASMRGCLTRRPRHSRR